MQYSKIKLSMPLQLYNKLYMLSVKTGLSMAQIVRDALVKYFKDNE